MSLTSNIALNALYGGLSDDNPVTLTDKNDPAMSYTVSVSSSGDTKDIQIQANSQQAQTALDSDSED